MQPSDWVPDLPADPPGRGQTDFSAVPTELSALPATQLASGGLPFAPEADDRYGPSAMVTPANAVTIIRLLLSPALLVMILAEPSSWAAVSFWIALAVTDGVDGHLARRFGKTRSGAFLDPLADKVLVLGAMFALVAAHRFWVLPVALITIREVAISLFRARLARQGLAVQARNLAKAKTVVQEVAVGFALLPLTVERPVVANTCLWLATALTLVTGAQYLLDGRGAATSMARAQT